MMDIDKLRAPDFEGRISLDCEGCAGISRTSNGRKTWLICFADKTRPSCGGIYNMDEFLKMEADSK